LLPLLLNLFASVAVAATIYYCCCCRLSPPVDLSFMLPSDLHFRIFAFSHFLISFPVSRLIRLCAEPPFFAAVFPSGKFHGRRQR
jgi:hypothetical protein